MATPFVSPSTSPGQPSANGSPLFYWEFDEPQRSAIRAQALADEGYLACQMNHGIRMLAVPLSAEEVPDLETLPPADANVALYSDAISDILQIAAWRGLDLQDIVDAAVRGVDTMLSYSAGAAATRPGR